MSHSSGEDMGTGGMVAPVEVIRGQLDEEFINAIKNGGAPNGKRPAPRKCCTFPAQHCGELWVFCTFLGRSWNDARTVACSQTSWRQVTRVRMVHRTLMSQQCHVFCLHVASAHLKSARTSTGHASTVPPLVNPPEQPSSRQLYGHQLRWTYANSQCIDWKCLMLIWLTLLPNATMWTQLTSSHVVPSDRN